MSVQMSVLEVVGGRCHHHFFWELAPGCHSSTGEEMCPLMCLETSLLELNAVSPGSLIPVPFEEAMRVNSQFVLFCFV